MKRKVFVVTSTAGHNFTKSAWNSSIRAIEDAARDLARMNGTHFRLVDSHSEKDGGTDHVRGTRTWEDDRGNRVTFSIQKVA